MARVDELYADYLFDEPLRIVYAFYLKAFYAARSRGIIIASGKERVADIERPFDRDLCIFADHANAESLIDAFFRHVDRSHAADADGEFRQKRRKERDDMQALLFGRIPFCLHRDRGILAVAET